MHWNVLIGGSAGQGIDTVGRLFEKMLQRSGYYVFTHKDLMSRIRGGHNFSQIRFGTEKVWGHDRLVDVIVALDAASIQIHEPDLRPEGIMIGEVGLPWESLDGGKRQDSNLRRIPMIQLAKESGDPKAQTTVALGYLARYMGLDYTVAHQVLTERFGQASEVNLKAFDKGYALTEKAFTLPAGPISGELLLNGNEAVALGALAGGVSFYSAYPMSPATGVMNYLSEKQNAAGIIVEQAEDEISAINMAIGASYAGIRAMTGSSGGGVALMTESMGLTGMMETPLVLLDVQRPSPATGLPTRTEQSDLSFLLTASHGEIPRMIISVKNHADAFYQVPRALNIADQYQMLVILMSDQYLADSSTTVPAFDLAGLRIERCISDGSELAEGETYKRYKFTDSGISPRLLPGSVPHQIVITDSDEHDEYGHITESSTMRSAMMNKRMKRMTALREELLEPSCFGVQEPDYLLVGWGSTEGALAEATDILNEKGYLVTALSFGDVYPLPEALLTVYHKKAKTFITVEQNFTGQLGRLIRQETGLKTDFSILKYDGRQISAGEIVERFEREVVPYVG